MADKYEASPEENTPPTLDQATEDVQERVYQWLENTGLAEPDQETLWNDLLEPGVTHLALTRLRSSKKVLNDASEGRIFLVSIRQKVSLLLTPYRTEYDAKSNRIISSGDLNKVMCKSAPNGQQVIITKRGVPTAAFLNFPELLAKYLMPKKPWRGKGEDIKGHVGKARASGTLWLSSSGVSSLRKDMLEWTDREEIEKLKLMSELSPQDVQEAIQLWNMMKRHSVTKD